MATHAVPVQVEGPAVSFEEYLGAYDGVRAGWVWRPRLPVIPAVFEVQRDPRLGENAS